MDYGAALLYVQAGRHIRRKGWNASNLWVCFIPAGNAMFKGYPMQDCLGLKTVDNKMQPGWVASISDTLATDWEIVED